MLYERWQKRVITHASKTRRILILSGAGQCGKTTLSKATQLDNSIYVTLDDPSILNAAKNNPSSFVQHDNCMMIIDEVQRVPELLLAVKKIVDNNNKAGQYMLTGSANIQSLPNVNESLAGRVRKIRLRTFTQGELLKKQPYFLKNSFEQNFKTKKIICNQENILKKAIQGGYPEAIKLNNIEKKQWHKDYIAALLDRDLQNIANIKNIAAMHSIVAVTAAWSSKFMDISAISSGLAITRNTITAYINALEALYIVERVHPWLKTDYDRVGKRSKLFMTDSGLMSSILNWNIDKIKLSGDKLGKLFETFIFNELASQIDAYFGEYELFQYRDKDKREIDFLIEREDGALLGIEVKAGSTIHKKNFQHLEWFAKNIAKENNFVGIVLYTGEYILSFGKNMWALPISILWN